MTKRPLLIICIVAILTLAGLDAFVIAKRRRYAAEITRLRAAMSQLERERADALVSGERRKLRVAIELARRQARIEPALHLSVALDSSAMYLERDGAVLPILHLNGYKIAGPTVLARIPRDELESLFRGYGYTPYFVEGDDPLQMHQLMAATLDTVVAEIKRIQTEARANGFKTRPLWPMIILRSPKGWTGPKVVDGKPTEGTFRSHQVPMGDMSRPGHVKILEEWLQSYRPQELFDQAGKLRSEFADLAPKGERRMSANPHANGGRLLRNYGMSPGTPKELLETIRKGFSDTMKDPEFMAAAEKAGLEVDPLSGEEVEKLVNDLFKTPAPIVEKLKRILLPK